MNMRQKRFVVFNHAVKNICRVDFEYWIENTFRQYSSPVHSVGGFIEHIN